MAERVKLFEPCYMEYKEYDKPVYYSEEFLKELASKVNSTKLVYGKHLTESIGDVSNFTFTDGALFGDVYTDKALDDLKYSPYIDCSLVEEDNRWLAVKPTGFTDICLTDKPRKVKLMNTEDGGSKMANNDNNSDNETIKILNGQVKDLNKQLAIAENKAKANEEKLKAYDELEKEVAELRQWKETNSKIIDEQKPIIEAYNKNLETRKEELLNKISNGNEEIKAKLQNESLETLENFDSLYAHEQPPKGVSANNAQGLNEGNGEDDGEAEQQARNDAVESMFGDLFNKEE